MKKSTYKVTRFDVNDDYYVEVSPYLHFGTPKYEFTLCSESWGHKDLMFCLTETECPEYRWENIIEKYVDGCIKDFEYNMNTLAEIEENDEDLEWVIRKIEL